MPSCRLGLLLVGCLGHCVVALSQVHELPQIPRDRLETLPQPDRQVDDRHRDALEQAIGSWGFERGLTGWQAEGDAFANQPTFGENVIADRIVGNGTGHAMPLGGSYWRETAFPIGVVGDFWIGTFENRGSAEQPRGAVRGDGATGRLTSRPFQVGKPFISFLIGGGRDSGRLRVELLRKVEGGYAAGRSRHEDGYYEGWSPSIRTGHDSELLRREWWDVRPLTGATVRIRITDQATGRWGHINVDDFRFLDHPPNEIYDDDSDLPTTTVQEAGGRWINRDRRIWIDRDAPIWGVVDMHTHPMSHLAFGGRIFSGAADGPAASALTNCGCDHGDPIDPTLIARCAGQTDMFRSVLVGQMSGDIADRSHFSGRVTDDPVREGDDMHGNGMTDGNGDFENWPQFFDGMHQQMWVGWLERAHQGGLRVIVALAHHNQLVAKVGNGSPGQDADDFSAFVLQIEGIRELVNRHDFMSLAESPAQLRRIVRDGRLAVVLGSEMDNIGNFYRPLLDSACRPSRSDCRPYNPNPSEETVRAEIRRLYDAGIRYMFPVHFANNVLSGAAITADATNKANMFYTGSFYQPETKRQVNDPGEDIGFYLRANYFDGSDLALETILNVRGIPGSVNQNPETSVSAPHRNSMGLTQLGRAAIDEIMRLGMMIDVDHMSERTLDEVLGIADRHGYPLNSGHNSFRALKHEASENARSDRQIDRLGDLGGLFGVGWQCDDMRNYAGSRPGRPGVPRVERVSTAESLVENDSAGSSKTFAQSLLYALESFEGRKVAFGTDINSLIARPSPRFGPYASYCSRRVQNETRREYIRRQSFERAAQADPVVYASAGETRALALVRATTGSKSWDINVDGVAHYGLLPDFMQDLVNVGVHANQMSSLFQSAEDFARMWERSVASSREFARAGSRSERPGRSGSPHTDFPYDPGQIPPVESPAPSPSPPPQDFPYDPGSIPPIQPAAGGCFEAVQGRIAWDYDGSTTWSTANLQRLCRGAEDSAEPGRCIERVMHGAGGRGPVNWGAGTRWSWQNAIDLCEGVRDVDAVISCFESRVAAGEGWRSAIAACGNGE